MNTRDLAVVALTSVLLVSCATTNFTEYRGESVVRGKGGAVRKVEGIDFWENGDPNRKYRILGVIDDTRGDGLISRARKDTDIAEVARQYGGDAVVLIGSDREIRGVDVYYGGVDYRRITKLLVVQYVD
jgi:hypothetical protein